MIRRTDPVIPVSDGHHDDQLYGSRTDFALTSDYSN